MERVTQTWFFLSRLGAASAAPFLFLYLIIFVIICIVKAVILAAGNGTRLRPITLEIPKPLIEIARKPIIERIFESLPDEIEEVIIVIEHLKEKIKKYLGDNFKNKRVRYAEQGSKKGTFGALLSAQSFLQPNERFLVLNGDDLHNQKELKKFLNYPRAFGVQHAIMTNYYNVIVEDGYIKGFRPQTEIEKINGTLIATGVYVLDSEIFKHPGITVFGGEYGLPQTILAQKDTHPLQAVVTTGWVPINSFADIEKMNGLI